MGCNGKGSGSRREGKVLVGRLGEQQVMFCQPFRDLKKKEKKTTKSGLYCFLRIYAGASVN